MNIRSARWGLIRAAVGAAVGAAVVGAVVGAVVLATGPGVSSWAQTGTSPAQTAPTPSTTSTGAAPGAGTATTKTARKRRSATKTGQMQRIPIEQAPPSPAGPDESAAQRAADQKLLQQQQAQSAQAARITDQQVKTAQQRIDKVQDEKRIQDGPGPSQVGIVPAAGSPVLPAAAGSGTSGGATIQDAPGPGETAAPATPTPAQTVPPQQT